MIEVPLVMVRASASDAPHPTRWPAFAPRSTGAITSRLRSQREDRRLISHRCSHSLFAGCLRRRVVICATAVLARSACCCTPPPVMAYSPLGGPGADPLHDPTLAQIGAAHSCSPAAVALAWTIRSGRVIAIPESGSPVHVKENAVAFSLTLTAQEFQALDAAHPPGR